MTTRTRGTDTAGEGATCSRAAIWKGAQSCTRREARAPPPSRPTASPRSCEAARSNLSSCARFRLSGRFPPPFQPPTRISKNIWRRFRDIWGKDLFSDRNETLPYLDVASTRASVAPSPHSSRARVWTRGRTRTCSAERPTALTVQFRPRALLCTDRLVSSYGVRGSMLQEKQRCANAQGVGGRKEGCATSSTSTDAECTHSPLLFFSSDD
mmetsp:Transcript_27711/g.48460  ORF Transcript_27711/g.48460 Transcript_27711/m.48460 type:complete len:211 (-) Transcript_27711:709-1341(-)